jgi:hypothetical protein
MRRFSVEIERLVVDAAGIAPLPSERFRVLVEQALQQRLERHGAPSAVLGRESVTIPLPEPATHEHTGGARLAGSVAQAIHQSLTRKA